MLLAHGTAGEEQTDKESHFKARYIEIAPATMAMSAARNCTTGNPWSTYETNAEAPDTPAVPTTPGCAIVSP